MSRWSFGPWLWSAQADLALFAGSAALALVLMLAKPWLGVASSGELPEWGFVAAIVAVDVAHVYSTLFRTYFDARECLARPLRYFGVPLALYAFGVLLYAQVAALFWRTLAYLALFHFVRQQAGWVAVYRARAGQTSRWDALLDAASVYAATLYPLAHWHAHLPETQFAWFVAGDFADLSPWLRPWLPLLQGLWALCLAAFLLRQAQLALQTRVVYAGKVAVVTTTAVLWYGGIVATNSDFDFTVTNVLAHGIPYMALLWFYAREHTVERPRSFNARVIGYGVVGFLCVLWLCAFVEEALWDRLVWREHGWLFGTSDAVPDAAPLKWLVPLLALPQATHYALDGVLWRRSDTRRLPAQRRALGFS